MISPTAIAILAAIIGQGLSLSGVDRVAGWVQRPDSIALSMPSIGQPQSAQFQVQRCSARPSRNPNSFTNPGRNRGLPGGRRPAGSR